MAIFRIPGLVSIIVTNYNNAPYIYDCLTSILGQTYQHIELIIVDDCSTDDSVAIIDNWITTNIPSSHLSNRVHFIKLPRNIGFSGAVTTALYLTQGEYIAMHDGDDYSSPSRITKQHAYLSSHASINAVGSDYLVIEGDTLVHYLNGIAFGVDTIRSIYSNGGNAVSYGTLMIRGEVFDHIGGLTRRLPGAEDYEFITHLLPYGVDNIQESLYYYRSHPSQRSRQFYSNTPSHIVPSNLCVLFVLDSLSIGGTETHVLTLIKSLLLKGIKIVILAKRGELSPLFDTLDIKIYNISFPLTVPEKNELFFYSVLFKNIIKSENVNIIHCHQSPSGAIGLIIGKELGIPTFFTIHGLYYQDIINTHLSLASQIISVSHPVQDWLTTHQLESTIIPNGVNFSAFLSKSSHSLPNLFAFPEDAFVVCYCSRFAWQKCEVAKQVCLACHSLRQKYNINIYAMLIGTGECSNDLSDLAYMLNQDLNQDFIFLPGPQLDIIPYFSASHCIIGSGRVAIEGIACCKPVIAIGNAGYVGLITDSSFEKAWQMYFGDHSSYSTDVATALKQDLMSLYYSRSAKLPFIDPLYKQAKKIFDIEQISNDIVNTYYSVF